MQRDCVRNGDVACYLAQAQDYGMVTTAIKHAFEPTPLQARILACPTYEVLVGGAAGSSKTVGLIMDALGLQQRGLDGQIRNAIDHPKYWALLVRQNATDLLPLEAEMQHFYGMLSPAPHYAKVTRTFHFPSGARIQMAHASDVKSVRAKYKGAEFAWIGFEELSEWASPDPYLYLLTRNRAPAGLQKFVRASSNPDGPGARWVKKRWRIPDGGEPVPPFVTENGRDMREFIPGRCWDNPYLDPDYEDRLKLQDDYGQQTLLYGRWIMPDIKGAVFGAEYRRAVAEGRVTKLPIERLPVNTFWDVGVGQNMAVWCHQRVGREDRMIDYLSMGSDLADYISTLKERYPLLGMHFLPHDARHRQVGDKRSRTLQQIMHSMGLRPTTILPRINTVAQGLAITRDAWPHIWFDEKRCAAGLEALQHYRWPEVPEGSPNPTHPLHDWASHGADALRAFAMANESRFSPDRSKADPEGRAPTRKERKRRHGEDESWVV